MTTLPRQLQAQQADVERIDREMAEHAAAQEQGQQTPPETPPLDPPPVTPPATPPVDPWQQRYQTLKGKYEAEVPRLHADVRELKARLDAAVVPKKTVETKTPRVPLVTDKDAETYGSDLVDLIRRQAQQTAADLKDEMEADMRKLEAENEALRNQVTGVTQKQEATVSDRYISSLAALVPDWEAINSDSDFLAWLDVEDPMSGLTRQSYLDNAFKNLDAQRTARLFNAWKAEGKAPPAPVEPSRAPQLDQELQRQITPGKSKMAPAQDVSSNQIWSTAEIAKFYNDVRAGVYKNAPDDARRIETEIDLAVSTGKVRA